jgi:hypothetical protein
MFMIHDHTKFHMSISSFFFHLLAMNNSVMQHPSGYWAHRSNAVPCVTKRSGWVNSIPASNSGDPNLDRRPAILPDVFHDFCPYLLGKYLKIRSRFLSFTSFTIHYSLTMVLLVKSRRMRWAGYVARMWRRGMHIGYWWESQKERDP